MKEFIHNHSVGISLAKLIVSRFLQMIVTLFIIATCTFFILNTVPGDPLGDRVEKMSETNRKHFAAQYGLDKPVGERYVIMLENLTHGDFGESVAHPGQKVDEIIAKRSPASIRLGLQQMIIGIPLGILLGILAAVKKNKWQDKFVLLLSVVLISVPSLILALVLQRYLGGELGWFPIIGWPEGKNLWFGGWEYTILPTICGCLSYISGYSRLLKNSMLDVLGSEYVQTAKAKGAKGSQIVKSHVIRNSFIPVVTGLPLTIAFGITGNFFIENIFGIPGLGKYYVQSVNERDMPMILGTTVILAAIYIVVVFITDFIYQAVDPRIRVFTAGKPKTGAITTLRRLATKKDVKDNLNNSQIADISKISEREVA